MATKSPLKWHGGKHYLARKILTLAPPRATADSPTPQDTGYKHYVEPFAGGLSVLLANDPEGISEVASDRHAGLMNFWAALQDPVAFECMRRILECTPFSEADWQRAKAICETAAFDAETPHGKGRLAADFFIYARQAMAGRLGRRAGFAPLSKNRTRRGMNEQASAWISAVDGLEAVHARMRRVVVLRGSALDIIRREDSPRTWFYLDPPYLEETRAGTGEYCHEMTTGDHAALLETLSGIQGRFTISGYPSALYDTAAEKNGWNRVDIAVPNNAAGGKAKRTMTECLWRNFH